VELARGKDRAGADNAMLDVAEVRAGLRSAPSDRDQPITRLLMTLTAEPELLIADLGKSLGPDDARRIVFRERGCGWTSVWGQLKRQDH